jgi:hypothetical protein
MKGWLFGMCIQTTWTSKSLFFPGKLLFHGRRSWLSCSPGPRRTTILVLGILYRLAVAPTGTRRAGFGPTHKRRSLTGS